MPSTGAIIYDRRRTEPNNYYRTCQLCGHWSYRYPGPETAESTVYHVVDNKAYCKHCLNKDEVFRVRDEKYDY